MRISFTTNASNLNTNSGYGVAGFNMVQSLQSLGHEVKFKDPSAPVEIAMCMPDFSSWSNSNAYHIQYTPWESTKLRDGWKEAFNQNSDEVWTTSPWVAEVYKAEGVERPIYVYEHGIADTFAPVRRKVEETFKYLHVGEPANRKGGQMAFDAFDSLYQNQDQVHLTIKAWTRSNIRVYNDTGNILGLPHEMRSNITTIYNDVATEEMAMIYRSHHALLYPSWGEGFGFIPLEAMATGLPVIMPADWAPYSRFVIPELTIKSELVDSPWDWEHPGKVFKPDFDSLVECMSNLAYNYNRFAGIAYKNAFKIKEEYDWVTLTEQAWSHIVEMFG